MAKSCQCKSADHGHSPGECTSAADPQKENMCAVCFVFERHAQPSQRVAPKGLSTATKETIVKSSAS